MLALAVRLHLQQSEADADAAEARAAAACRAVGTAATGAPQVERRVAEGRLRHAPNARHAPPPPPPQNQHQSLAVARPPARRHPVERQQAPRAQARGVVHGVRQFARVVEGIMVNVQTNGRATVNIRVTNARRDEAADDDESDRDGAAYADNDGWDDGEADDDDGTDDGDSENDESDNDDSDYDASDEDEDNEDEIDEDEDAEGFDEAVATLKRRVLRHARRAERGEGVCSSFLGTLLPRDERPRPNGTLLDQVEEFVPEVVVERGGRGGGRVVLRDDRVGVLGVRVRNALRSAGGYLGGADLRAQVSFRLEGEGPLMDQIVNHVEGVEVLHRPGGRWSARLTD